MQSNMSTAYFGKFKVGGQKTGNTLSSKKIDKHINTTLSTDKLKRLVKNKRQKNGCFCCRKRRIKCDVLKPSCNNCTKSSYVCIWPNGDESLPHNSEFQLTRIDKNLKKKERSLQVAVIDTTDDTIPEIMKESSNNEYSNVDQLNEKYPVLSEKVHGSSEILQDAMFRKVLIEINSSVSFELFSSLSHVPSMSEQNSILYDAFVNGFITDVSPQFTHFKLQPASAFIPTGIDNPIVRQLFFACGASFLYSASKSEEMKALARLKFNQSAHELKGYISENNIRGNEDWILVFLLLSYLKLRFVYDGQRTQTLSMISIIEAVNLWILNKQSGGYSSKLEKKITEIDDNVDENLELDDENLQFSNNNDTTGITFKNIADSFRMILAKQNSSSASVPNSRSILLDSTSIESEVFLAFNETKPNQKNEINLLPYERTMLESFIFNYSNMIFTCDRSLIAQITSPFIIFDRLRPYLSVPLYKCAVPWMNHPVVGAALPIFELQAKITWLALFTPLSEKHSKIVLNIRKTAKYYIRPILPAYVHYNEPEEVQKKLMESCYVAEIVAKSVFIYSTKLLYPEEDIRSELIQDVVEMAYQALLKISIQSQVHMILGFSFAVIGATAIKQHHRDYFIWKLRILRQVFKVKTFEALEDFFYKAWSSKPDEEFERGWDVLFDSECIKPLVI